MMEGMTMTGARAARRFCRAGLLLLLALPVAAQPFPLEDYVPADFHRRYLSLSPRLDWELSDREWEGPLASGASDRGQSISSLRAVHGTDLRLRSLRWSSMTSAGLHGFLAGGGGRDRGYQGSPPTLYQSDSEDGQGTFSYLIASRLSGRWYPAGPWFLGASAEQDLSHVPHHRTESVWARLYSGRGTDPADYAFSAGEGRSASVQYAGVARAAAGAGRIEDVSFAETALFLLDRIADVTGRRVRLDPEGMRALEAHVEARRKARPFADFRLASVHDLESVDAFLRERAGMEPLTARAVLEMADEWNHGFRHPRESGWEWTVYPFLRWDLDLYRSRHTVRDFGAVLPADPEPDLDTLSPDGRDPDPATTVRRRIRRYQGETAFGLGTRLSARRPWRRFWQFDADLVLRGSLVDRETTGSERVDTVGGTFPETGGRGVDYAFPLLEATYAAAAHYYPSSRTAVSLRYDARLAAQLDYVLDGSQEEALAALAGRDLDQDLLEWRQSLGLDGRYFLSHRLSVDAWFRVVHDGRETEDAIFYGIPAPIAPTPGKQYGSNLSFLGSAGLTYYLF